MNKALLLSLSLVTLTFAAPVALASESGTHSCTTTIGLGNPVISVSADLTEEAGVALGGCNLVVISDTHEVTAVNPADGCSVSVDVDGDGLGDANPAVGDVYEAGSNFFVTCDLGVLDVDSSITLA